ncbi:MAG TPA: class I SAM-dependent methyltransferase [Dermatophilaceae bacterium]|nr:class I SAM-dependent methyltransferase [Dermatophilaceae bacterium]
MLEPIPSPNIWADPAAYELENLGADPDGRIEQAMAAVHDWAGGHLLDIGCGSGFHLPLFARRAAQVTGVEPHPPLAALARARVAGLEHVRVLLAPAQALPLPEHSVDVAHARWAYFFGPGCEPGLAELERVMRPGGTAFVVDNDATRSTFGRWFRRAHPGYDPLAVERFWRRHGWQRERLDIRWSLRCREDFAAVVRIEFAGPAAEAILAEHPGTNVDYAVNLWWRQFG